MREWICGRCYTGLMGETATTCPSCGGTDIVPTDSPRGQQMAALVAPPVVIETQRGDAVCPSCLAFGRPRHGGASALPMLILLMLTVAGFVFAWPVGAVFLVILLVYSAQPDKKLCGKCGAPTIPADSQRGQELLRGKR